LGPLKVAQPAVANFKKSVGVPCRWNRRLGNQVPPIFLLPNKSESRRRNLSRDNLAPGANPRDRLRLETPKFAVVVF